MRISDWSSDVCSSDLLHGSARPFGRQLIKAGNDKIGNTGPDSIVDAAGSGDLDRSPAHGAGRCKILGGIVAHIGEGRWRKTIFRHDRQIGRAPVCTPVTNAHLLCRPLPEKKKIQLETITHTYLTHT